MRLVPRFTIVEWLVLLAIGGLLSTFVYDEVQERLGARDGLNDAESEIASGELKLKFAGKPPYCREHMEAIFRERYGITLEYVGGCCPSPYRRGYNRGYDDRMLQAIRLRIPGFTVGPAYESVRADADKRQEAQLVGRT